MLLLWIAGRLRHLLHQRGVRAPCPAGAQLPAGGAGRARVAAPAAAASFSARSRAGAGHDSRARLRHPEVRPHRQQHQAGAVLPPPVRRARAEVGRVSAAPPGGVLAPTPFAAVVPSQTGRAVWVGHGYWSPDYPVQRPGGRRPVSRPHAPAAGAGLRARDAGRHLLLADCNQHGNLARLLRPLIQHRAPLRLRRGVSTGAGERKPAGRPAGRRTADPTRSRRSRIPCCRPGRRPAPAPAPPPRSGRWPRPSCAWATRSTGRRPGPAPRAGSRRTSAGRSGRRRPPHRSAPAPAGHRDPVRELAQDHVKVLRRTDQRQPRAGLIPSLRAAGCRSSRRWWRPPWLRAYAASTPPGACAKSLQNARSSWRL